MDTALVGSLVLGTLSAAALVASRIRRGTRAGPAEVVTAFLSAGGLSVGADVCLLSLDYNTNMRGLDGQRIYVLLAGLCMVWVSVLTTLDLHRRGLQGAPGGLPTTERVPPKPG